MIASFFKRRATVTVILAFALLFLSLAKIAAHKEGWRHVKDVDTVLDGPTRDASAVDDPDPWRGNNGKSSHVDEVEFPNGSTVKVSWRTVPIPSIKVSPPYVEDYPMLREKAALGDPEAGYVLYDILESCKFAYEGEVELEGALHQLKSTHRIQAPEMDEPVLLQKVESVRNWEVILKKSYEACAGISQSQKAERYKWLEIAANAAYPIAMREYSSTIADYEMGVSLDLARWHEGDAQALRSLAKRYWANFQDGHKPTDNVAAYASMYAFLKIARENATLYVHEHDRRLETFESELEDLRRRLHKHEIDAAESEAKRLIKSNSNCCFSF